MLGNPDSGPQEVMSQFTAYLGRKARPSTYMSDAVLGWSAADHYPDADTAQR